MRYAGFVGFMLFSMVNTVIAVTPAQERFLKTVEKETTSMELPCSCDCHRHIYNYRACPTCAHRGGIYMQSMLPKEICTEGAELNQSEQENQGEGI